MRFHPPSPLADSRAIVKGTADCHLVCPDIGALMIVFQSVPFQLDAALREKPCL